MRPIVIHKINQWFALYIKGLFMGVADLVPGVSGGTIAFALGIHPDLLKSLKTLRFSSIRYPKQVAWFFLSALVLGIGTSLALGAHVIYYLLNHPIYQSFLRALFSGLIMGSIYFCLKKILRWNSSRVFCLCIGAVTALTICLFNVNFSKQSTYNVPIDLKMKSIPSDGFANYDFETGQLKNVSLAHIRTLLKDGYIHPKTWIYNLEVQKYVQVDSCMEFSSDQVFDLKLVVCGALSICAMLLPGISGTQVMQMFGSYELIIESITIWTRQLTYGSFINPSFWVLFNVGIGILLGITLFSRFFIFLYRKYYYATLALLAGFMIGSLPSLWPFWSLSYKVHLSQTGANVVLERLRPLLPNLISYQTWIVFLMMVLGLAILLVLERMEQKKQQENLVS